ncbi:HNH endonuclease [Oceanobacillus sojae]|uniref:HNH endonuclease n=1 Tax=Oceanobacillus sojae TaxID=582851 RepID=UPI003637B7C9
MDDKLAGIKVNLIGRKHNMLEVLDIYDRTRQGTRWLCKCECGEETVVNGYKLKNGLTKSCGCLKNKHSEETKRKISEANNKQIHFNCDYCNERSSEKRSSFNKYEKHFCSKKCYSDYVKERMDYTEMNAYKGVRKPGESKQVYHRRYVKKHPERIARLKAERYLRERNAEGSHTLEDWDKLKMKFNNKCAHCGEKKELTKDHIVPLLKGGTNYISNIQPLCRNCNSKKWAKDESDLLEGATNGSS